MRDKNEGKAERVHRAKEGRVSLADRLLVVLGYLLFFPVFHVILTERRKNLSMAVHAGQAFLMWLVVIGGVIALRAFVFAVLSSEPAPLLDKIVPVFFFACWICLAWCALLFLFGKKFKVPVITPIADWLA